MNIRHINKENLVERQMMKEVVNHSFQGIGHKRLRNDRAFGTQLTNIISNNQNVANNINKNCSINGEKENIYVPQSKRTRYNSQNFANIYENNDKNTSGPKQIVDNNNCNNNDNCNNNIKLNSQKKHAENEKKMEMKTKVVNDQCQLPTNNNDKNQNSVNIGINSKVNVDSADNNGGISNHANTNNNNDIKQDDVNNSQKKENTLPLRRSLRIAEKKVSEVKDKSEDEIMSWDRPDVDDDLFVTDYVHNIVEHLRNEENCYKNVSDYMRFQTNVNSRMRAILVDWLISVHRKFRCLPSTLFLTVNLLDRYLSKMVVDKSSLQLIGCACMWIASKYHEIYAPEASDFAYISDYAFTIKNLIEMESNVIFTLDFQICVPTILSFSERYLKIGCYQLIEKNKIEEYNLIQSLTHYLMEHSLLDYEYCVKFNVKPSLIASAAIAYSLLGTNIYNEWPLFLEKETQYGIKDLIPLMKRFDELRNNQKYESIKRKYSSPNHNKITLLNFDNFKHRKFYQ